MSDPVLSRLAARALDFISEGQVVGLGTGRAASAVVRTLGERVRAGWRVAAVPTSEATEMLARDCGITLLGLDDTDVIDVTIDGADEVDPQLNLIKGYGGALLREKVVAAASRLEVIVVGSEKLVAVLGSRGKLPVEVIPFALGLCRRRLEALNCGPILRLEADQPFRTDSGNYILDCAIQPLAAPAALDLAIHQIPGVVDTGLFLGVAHHVLIGDEAGVRELHRH